MTSVAPRTSRKNRQLMEMFGLMLDHFGPRNWWPAETPLEMMIGAVLTQNTSWRNVEQAIGNLRKRGLISVKELHRLDPALLAAEIRPAGYFNIKADRLKQLMAFIVTSYGGDINRLIREDTRTLRQGLLKVRGIGPETADSILLYAAAKPAFVIDAYTHRILNRHGMAPNEATYGELQELFTDNLPEDPALFNEFHALIVETGKEYCRKKPRCGDCPLRTWETLSLE